MTAQNPTARFEAAMEGLSPGGHVCSITESKSDTLVAAATFLRIGLERGEKCVYVITDAADGEGLRRALRNAGVDVFAAVASGALALITAEEASLRGDAFDPYRLITYWKRLAAGASAEGFAALRAGSDMQHAVRTASDPERWLEYERQLTQLTTSTGCRFLCQYDRARFPVAFLLDVVRAHPCVIHRSTVAQNICYVSDAEATGSGSCASELEWLLGEIYKREQLLATLGEVIAHGGAARDWLEGVPLNVEEAKFALNAIISDARRASEELA
jgi:chemotaxis family two-component system sensor kinase Cph1